MEMRGKERFKTARASLSPGESYLWASHGEIARFKLTPEQKVEYKQNGRLDFSNSEEKPRVFVTGEAGVVEGLLYILQPEYKSEITIQGKTYKVKDRACVILSREGYEKFFPSE